MTVGKAPRGTGRRRGPRGWTIWSLPRRTLLFVLAVDGLALVLGPAISVAGAPEPSSPVTALVLVVGAVIHIEAARHIEHLRNEDSAEGPYVDAKSMWSFAALVLLAPGPALAVVVFTLVWWRLRVSHRPPLYRWVFSAATVVLGSCAAWAVLRLAGPEPAQRVGDGLEVVVVLVAAALLRWVVNHGLVVVAIGLTSPATSWRCRLGAPSDHLVGLGALALGIALAVLVEATPWLVAVLLVPVLAMHRGLLLGHFARAARTDPKTGLTAIAHWRDHAVRELARARRRGSGLGVLMLDLDEFKAVNDRWGHLTGDLVLRAVADALRGEVRPYDAIGRFGGEEFVVLLAEVDPEQLCGAAERIRRRVAECQVPVAGAGPGTEVARGTVSGLTVSVGAASYPETADELDELMAAADRALLAAKRAGRDRVRLAEAP